MAALLSAPDNFLFVCPVYRTALPVYCVSERQKGGLNAMSTKDKILQILRENPDLLEYALSLVIAQVSTLAAEERVSATVPETAPLSAAGEKETSSA